MKKLNLENVRIYSNTKDDILDAMDLIDKEVYMSNFSDFNTYDKCNLAGVVGIKHIKNDSRHFLAEGDNGLGFREYKYLILAKDAKFIEETPKKLRPFTSTYEFTQVTGCDIGDVITIRRIDGKFEESCVVNGYRYCLDSDPSKPGIVYITLGAFRYSLQELLLCFEYSQDGEWKPFGIEE